MTSKNDKAKGLSKSRYMLSIQCLKALWLKNYKFNEPEDVSTNARIEEGREVGRYARELFKPFVDVTVERDGGIDIKAMIERTKEEMAKGTDVICEASFSSENIFCAVDILRKTPDGWAVYEVKSTTFSMTSKKKKDLTEYASDIAYQKWVLEQCGVNVTDTYLVCLNSDYVRQGELDIQELFVIIDMKELVDNEYLKVPAQVKQALEILNKDQEPDVDLSINCKDSGKYCDYFNYCKSLHGVPDDKPTVFELHGMWLSTMLKYYNAGQILFEDLRNEKLSPINHLQIECELNNTEHIDVNSIRNFLDTLSYPLYFLDFETLQLAIPQYDNHKPYQQITFQYSLHIKESADAEYQHKEFLAPSDGSDPRRALAEQLCKDIPMDVCTLAFNKGFECGRIKELATIYPDLAVHLMNIHDNIKDLLVPFSKGCYYVPAMHGSFSIKSVLPALFPNEPSLDYHSLNEICRNGGDALTLFPRIKDMEPKEAEASREALLRYCELDTWAMVKVWEKLKEVVKI